MKLILKGHDYKYAVEQIMLMLFPEERPEYVTKVSEGDTYARVSLKRSDFWTTAFAAVCVDGVVSRAFSRVKTSELTDKLAEDRLCQKIIKLAFYRAAVYITGKKPEWGALTGIRPGKIAASAIKRGATSRQAAKQLSKVYFVSENRARLCVEAAEYGLRAAAALEKKDVCLYVGIPFCPTRCAYCSFVSSSVERSMKLIEPFLAALHKEMDKAAETAAELGLRVVSVYIGGGTPTTLSAEQLSELIAHLRSAFSITENCEFTVEAGRPDTITPEKLSAMKKSGVTRISINPQTMEDHVLEKIGRRHTSKDTVRAFKQAREAGFDNINMDMIAGLPGDTSDGFCRSLDKVMELGPENITVHTLSLKKGTKITLEGTVIPSGDEVGIMLDYAQERLRGSGYEPYYLYRQKFMSGGYENIGWCRPGTENMYNICIMEELCTILAIGGGASSKLVNPGNGRIERVFNAKYPTEYIENIERILESKNNILKFYEEEKL